MTVINLIYLVHCKMQLPSLQAKLLGGKECKFSHDPVLHVIKMATRIK